MTVNVLQEQLIQEIEKITKDMNLINWKHNPAELKGYAQSIPIQPVFEAIPYESDEDMQGTEEDMVFPYFIVRVDGVEYHAKAAEEMGALNQAHIIIAFALYDDDPDMCGYFSLTSVLERTIKRFQTNPVLGAYFCSRQMNTAYQEDDTFPQFFAALEMTWYLPDIEVTGEMEDYL